MFTSFGPIQSQCTQHRFAWLWKSVWFTELVPL
uniref:Uncharacterized protein n=1 Tax=Anguilla anguilla TaxID=7936 RepID=A0A0E9PSQ1_ANGAN